MIGGLDSWPATDRGCFRGWSRAVEFAARPWETDPLETGRPVDGSLLAVTSDPQMLFTFWPVCVIMITNRLEVEVNDSRDHVLTPVQGFLVSNARFRGLQARLGSEKARRFWERQELICVHYAADCWQDIEAIRSAADFTVLLQQFTADFLKELRRDDVILDLFEGHAPEDLEAALEFTAGQIPHFLVTRPGQHYRLVPA